MRLLYAITAFLVGTPLSWLTVVVLVLGGVAVHRWWTFSRPIYVRERAKVVRARRLGLARRTR